MRRAILMPFHKYTPFGGEYYEPLLNFFLQQMRKYQDEFDALYIIDSTWNIKDDPLDDKFYLGNSSKESKITIVKVDPHLRYYDAYKAVLDIKEDLVLLLDNDTVIYREGVINKAFKLIEYTSMYDEKGNRLNEKPMVQADVVSIIDQIGEYKTDKLKLGNKFCPYFFATRKELLEKYIDIDWSPHMPHSETLGLLTEKMLEDNVSVLEMEDDKSNCLFDGTQDGKKGKDFGYYHIRAGSTPAYLLATKHFGNPETYWKYLKEQPKSEYLRQAAWYTFMKGESKEIYSDAGIEKDVWDKYIIDFKKYHGLEDL